MNNNELEEKGKLGEEFLNQWLKENGLAYLYINQDIATFSPLFQNNIKRPDFLVLLESVGIIAVDAKNYDQKEYDKKLSYTLSLEEEVKRVMTFERIFRIPFWYAYFHLEGDKKVWYWISALKAIEVGTRKISEDTEFLAIYLEHFERIESNADLGKLYTHRLPGIKKIAAFLDKKQYAL